MPILPSFTGAIGWYGWGRSASDPLPLAAVLPRIEVEFVGGGPVGLKKGERMEPLHNNNRTGPDLPQSLHPIAPVP